GWLAATLGVGDARIGFERSEFGRPALRLDGRATAFDCNWSHSGNRLAIALGDGVQVGIDIERPRPRPRALELAHRYFTSAEADGLADIDAPEQARAFLRLWCAKEAVLKAHGRGLAFGLDRLRFDGIEGTPRLVAADAMLGAVGTWTVEALDAEDLVGMVAWRALRSGINPGPPQPDAAPPAGPAP
ncbi:4'-phosphopantetheinyl transferase family protein, partial [Cognatilysobacter lacus]